MSENWENRFLLSATHAWLLTTRNELYVSTEAKIRA